jgi:hypothetical protein
MIQVTPQMRVLVAIEPVDFRNGIDGLAQVARERLETDPFSGCMFVFRNRSGTAAKVLVYDGQGFWLCQNHLSSHCTSFDGTRGFCFCRRFRRSSSIGEPVPSTAVLERRIRSGHLIQIRVRVVRVSRNDPVLRPAEERDLVDAEAGHGLFLRQHPSVSKAVEAGAEPVTVDEVADSQRSETSIVSSRAR